MQTKLDPRLWNLFAGAALIGAGCGPGRVAGQEVGDGETAESEAETVETAEAEAEVAPECVVDSDCGGTFYYCYEGVCEYVPHHDGWVPYYDCYDDSECPDFELCVFGYCEIQGEPPPLCGIPSMAVGIPLMDAGLALSFADVDVDGLDELVIATATSLVVHDFEGGIPTVTAADLSQIRAMVGGEFDEFAGEDLLVLIGDELRLYGSNGDGSFAPAVTSPTPIGFVNGLIAGDFDGAPPTDVLGWGGTGAYLQLDQGVTIATDQQVFGAAAFEFSSAAPGYTLRRTDALDVYNLDSQLTGSVPALMGSSGLAAFHWSDGVGYANVMLESSWGRVLVSEPSSGLTLFDWLIPVQPQEVLAGDLDGDGVDELVFNFSAGMAIEVDPRGPGDCWDSPIVPVEGVARGVVFGDHDDDGDLELAILSSIGEVALIDGG